MRYLKDTSIKRKQVWIIMLTSGVALLLACAGFVSYEIITFRRTMVQNLSSLAEIFANNSTAALDFNVPKDAEEILKALSGDPHILSAAIYGKDGQPFAEYRRRGLGRDALPATAPAVGHEFQADHLHLTRPVELKGERIGTIHLKSDLTALSSRLRQYAEIVVTVLGAALFVAFLLSSRLQRLVSDPILALAKLARTVAVEKNYSVRAAQHSRDEVGQLIGSFNEMLGEIQKRDAALQEAQATLEKRVAERTHELAHSLSVLHATLESTADGILVVDLQGRIVTHNEKFVEMWGVPRDVMASKDDGAAIASVLGQVKDPDGFVNQIKELYADVCRESYDLIELKDDRVFERYSQPQKAAGQCVGRVWSFRDITERRRAEEAIRKSDERFQLVTRATNDAVWDWDVASNSLWWNPGFQALFGYKPEEIEPDLTSWTDRLHPEDKERVLKGLHVVLDTGKDYWSDEYRFRRADGQYAHIFDRGYVIRDAQDKPLRMVGAMVDISERKQALEAMKLAKEAAEAASLAKSQFLANMSHEIRTPMNGIIGMTRLALETELTEEQRGLLATVRDSADTLLSIINDILDFSKIEAGKLELDPVDFPLRESVEDTLLSLALRAHQKGLELACHLPPDIPDALIGDAVRLRQVIVNLVGNAIKFTEQGEIVLRAAVKARGDDSVLLQFTVADTGIGIPQEKQSLIFEAFTQADYSTTRLYGGTGLGLAITSNLVELMGGVIWVESEVGHGSRFHFTARFGLQKNPAPHLTVNTAQLQGLSVLVVDDSPTNQCILLEVLTNWGMCPTVAGSGPAALNLLAGPRSFPVVLLDCLMPEMDGFAVAERLKANPAFGNSVIMMLSSTDQLRDAARCKELGIAAYLTKPVKQSDLLDAIISSLGAKDTGFRRIAPPSSTVALRPRRPLRVLLAEDNSVNQRLAVRTLEKWGHAVTVADNGRAAVEAYARAPFDLVLMDVQMPVMSGFEATAEIRRRQAQGGPRVPIVAMTAHAMKGDREKCLRAGMDAYLTKPFDHRKLFELLESLTGAAPAAETAAPASAADDSAVPVLQVLAAPGAAGAFSFDRQAVLERVGGDRELLKEVAGLFFQDAPGLLEQVRAAIERGDHATLERAAHTLKGSVSNFGSPTARELALRLENMGRQRDLAQAGETFPQLQEQITQLTSTLAALLREEAA